MAETQPPLESKPIRAIYNPSDDVKKVIRMVYDRKQAMEDSQDRQEAMAKMNQWERQWEGYRAPKRADDWQSNHVVPLTLSVVETALSEIVKQNLRPFVLPRGKEDNVRAKLMQHIYDYAWEVSDGDIFLYDSIHDLLIYGTVIAQEYYRVDRRKIGTITIKKENKETVTYEDVVDYDDVSSEVVKHQDFFVDEFARSFTGPYAARDCIRRYVMNIDDFHAMYDNSVWDQFNDAAKVKAGGDTAYYEFFRPPQGMDTSKQVEVLHYWNKPKDKFIIVANDVLIRNNPNPYKHKQLPFSRGIDIKRAHKFYAKGEPELLESIQDEINVLRRMIIDRNHLDIDKMFFVSNKLGLSDEDLIARPHGMIPTDDTSSAKAIEYGDIPRSVELSLKHLEDDSTISTGINPRAQALPSAGTATEAAILKESTLRRIETKIFLLKREYLIRLARLRLSNILQFYPQPKLEKIVGEKDSQKLQEKLAQASSKGSLQQIDGQNYEKQYRQIRIEGKEMQFDDKGKLVERPTQGYSFFELTPNSFMPMERGGYDIKFNVGANIEISKPLKQTKDMEMYDRLMQVALTVPGSYDPVKLGDMLIENNDYDPEEFKVEQKEVVDESGQRLQTQIQLASFENQMMLKGQNVPATQYASPAHTQIHTEFMLSPTFQQIPDPNQKIAEIFTRHVMGELMAQEARGMQGVGAPAAGQELPMQEGQPGQPGTQATTVAQGKENKASGMKKPANKVGDVMPSLNTGGNRNLP